MEDIHLAHEKELPKKKSGFRKFVRVFIVILILIAGVSIWWKYYKVYGQGAKAGVLNYVVKKGNVFKTYEGELILNGFRSKIPGNIESDRFKFSIVNDSLANILMNNSGKEFNLHYKEYQGTLWWRGFSNYIVDEIISMKEVEK